MRKWSWCAGRGRPPVFLWQAVAARRGARDGCCPVFGAGVGARVLRLLLLRLALVVWGAVAGDAVVQVVVVLGVAPPAGGRAESRRWCRGRALSASDDPVAGRRVAVAAVYKVERRLLLDGERYGGGAAT